MILTFECGICHSSYQFDAAKMGTSGIKITCPRCLSFFFLREHDHTHPEAIVEKVAEQDGAFQVNFPASEPLIETFEESEELLELSPHTDPKIDGLIDLGSPNSEETLAFQEVPDPTPAHNEAPLLSADNFDQFLEKAEKKERTDPRGMAATDHHTGKMSATMNLTQAELADYPEETPPESKFDGLLIPLSMIGIVIAAMLFLNYRRVILIPGLDQLRMAPVTQEVEPTPAIVITPKAQYGFPVIEDPAPAETTVTPTTPSDNSP